MKLFQLFKRDESKRIGRRRESAPPLTQAVAETSQRMGTQTIRDEAYLRALAKFNEWRSNQQQHHHIPNNSIIRIVESDETDDEPHNDTDNVAKTLNGHHSHFERHERFSAPTVATNYLPTSIKNTSTGMVVTSPPNGLNKTPMRRPPKKRTIAYNIMQRNTIAENMEVDNFERAHCGENGTEFSPHLITQTPQYSLSSPPIRFYRENDSPYANTDALSTPKRTAGSGIAQTLRRRKKEQAPQPPPPFHDKQHTISAIALESIANTSDLPPRLLSVETKDHKHAMINSFNGSYKHYDLNCSFLANARLAEAQQKTVVLRAHDRKYGAAYQTVVNKHGDIVEYALPFIDVENDTRSCGGDIKNVRSPQPPPHANHSVDTKHCEDLINENFRFLHDKYSGANDSTASSFLNRRIDNVVVTDLDKSFDTATKSLYNSNENILKELDFLRNWSKNIQQTSNTMAERNEMLASSVAVADNDDGLAAKSTAFEYFLKMNSSLTFCWPNEIKHRTALFRNTFPSPLVYSSGVFRNTPVSVRKYTYTNSELLKLSETAAKREVEILSQIRHADITVLMGICYDRGLNQATLILEPFDFTLNHYIHAMDMKLTVLQCITIVHQTTAAALYLQESGLIHSNISSHCIFVRGNNLTAKLGSFELTTDISDEVRHQIETEFGDKMQSPTTESPIFVRERDYVLMVRNSNKNLFDKYSKISKHAVNLLGNVQELSDIVELDENLPSKYLAYSTAYRQKFSLHFYQAPELISSMVPFVFPTRMSDVYSLTLLLWELLNGCVPFVIYTATELEKLYSANQAKLPIFEMDRCKDFANIFDLGLKVNATHRIMNVHHLLSALEDIRSSLLKRSLNKKNELAPNEVLVETHAIPAEWNETKNEQQQKHQNNFNEKLANGMASKTKPKEYFETINRYVNIEDPHRRCANAIIGDSFNSDLFNGNDAKSSSATFENKSSEVEINYLPKTENSYESIDQLRGSQPNVLCCTPPMPKLRQRTNGELSTLTKPRFERSLDADKHAAKESAFCMSISSGTQQSMLDFNKELSSNIQQVTPNAKVVIYERTSTLKRMRATRSSLTENGGITVEELFIPPVQPESVHKVNAELDAIADDLRYTRYDFLKSIKANEIQNYSPPSPPSPLPQCDDLPKQKLPKKKLNKTLANQNSSAYLFKIEDFTLPDMPIARKNKIRRNAWLSDQKLEVKEIPVESNSDGTLPKTLAYDVSFSQPLAPEFEGRRMNVNLKIMHNHKEIYSCDSSPLGKALLLEGRSPLKSIKLFHKNDSTDEEKPTGEVSVKVTAVTKKSRHEKTVRKSKSLSEKTNLSSEIRKCLASNAFKKLLPDFTKKIIHELDALDINSTEDEAYGTDSKTEDQLTTKIAKPTSDKIIANEENKPQKSSAETTMSPSPISSGRSQDLPTSEKRILLNDAFIKFRNNQMLSKSTNFENMLWRQEKKLCENVSNSPKAFHHTASVDTSPCTPVRDTIRKFEAEIESPGSISQTTVLTSPPFDQKRHTTNVTDSPQRVSALLNVILKNTKTSPPQPAVYQPNQLTSTPSSTLVKRTIFRESFKNVVDTNVPPRQPSSEPNKKITTRVTLNMRKVNRRASDIGHDLANRHSTDYDLPFGHHAEPRHTFCGNELQPVRIRANISTNRSDKFQHLGPAGIRYYVCCKCGAAKVQNNRDDGDGGIVHFQEASLPPFAMFNLNSAGQRAPSSTEIVSHTGGDIAAVNPSKCCQAVAAALARSTEDLYIDDDFCQGLKLGANMALVAASIPDFLTDFDFDIVSDEMSDDDQKTLIEDDAPGETAA